MNKKVDKSAVDAAFTAYLKAGSAHDKADLAAYKVARDARVVAELRGIEVSEEAKAEYKKLKVIVDQAKIELDQADAVFGEVFNEHHANCNNFLDKST